MQEKIKYEIKKYYFRRHDHVHEKINFAKYQLANLVTLLTHSCYIKNFRR